MRLYRQLQFETALTKLRLALTTAETEKVGLLLLSVWIIAVSIVSSRTHADLSDWTHRGPGNAPEAMY